VGRQVICRLTTTSNVLFGAGLIVGFAIGNCRLATGLSTRCRCRRFNKRALSLESYASEHEFRWRKAILLMQSTRFSAATPSRATSPQAKRSSTAWWELRFVRQVFDFVQQPKSPNLYWALTTLPQPLIEIRDALDVERMGIELSFPELNGIESAKRTPDEWRQLFHGFAKEVMEQSSNGDSPPPLTADQLEERCQRLLPAAQQTLIGSGMAKDQVEAMPIHQVALLYTPLIHREMVDDVSKNYVLPYPQASVGIDAVIARAKEREIIPLAAQMGSGFRTARSAVARNERTVAVLRVIESLRLYAAMHSGKLPDSLSEIVEVPVPVDPITGAAFEYRREGEIATLQATIFRNVAVNYEITMVSP
jgi:hypothetical protein